MKAGSRLRPPVERRRIAIGSMANGTAGGQFKTGMPIVETRRVPLVAEPDVCLDPNWTTGNGVGATGALTVPAGEGLLIVFVVTTNAFFTDLPDFTEHVSRFDDSRYTGIWERTIDGTETSIDLDFGGSQPWAAAAAVLPGPRVSSRLQSLTSRTSPWSIDLLTQMGLEGPIVGVLHTNGTSTGDVAMPDGTESGSIALVDGSSTVLAQLHYFASEQSGTYTFSSSGANDLTNWGAMMGTCA